MEILMYALSCIFFLSLGTYLGYKCHIFIYDLIYSIRVKLGKEKDITEFSQHLDGLAKIAYQSSQSMNAFAKSFNGVEIVYELITKEERLQQAIEQEDYELANKIKKEIDKENKE